MLIRAAIPADVPAILKIERACAGAAHWTEEEYKRGFDESSVSRKVLVAEEDGVVGFLIARTVAGDWELENVAVRPESQGRGAGSALLGRLLELVGAQPQSRLMLEVRASNAAARKLYEKHGLVLSGRRKEYYRNPTEDAILYDILV